MFRHQSRRNVGLAPTTALESLEVRQLLSVTSQLVADLEKGQTWGSNIEHVTFGTDIAYFTAFTESAGTELWKTDGTSPGTALVRDILPGPGSSRISQITIVGENVYFAASRSMYSALNPFETILWMHNVLKLCRPVQN